MAGPKQIYRRLTGRKRTLSGYTQLWLGSNHILLVKSTHFAEEYRRFALSDIQAIVVTSLAERRVAHMVGALAAIGWMSGALAVGSVFGKIFFSVTGALALTAVIVDIARGQRCVCYLQTAVSRERLAPVSRWRNARTFLERIESAIVAVQGTLAPDQLTGERSRYNPNIAKPPEVELPRGHAAEILFGLLLVDALLLFLDQRFPQSDASSVLFGAMAAEIVLASLVLIRAGARNLQRLIPSLALIALFCIAWDATGLLRGVGRWGMEVWATAQQGKPVMATFTWSHSRPEAWFAGLWRLGVGLIGLTALYFERKERAHADS
jgi:hypothetical protein